MSPITIGVNLAITGTLTIPSGGGGPTPPTDYIAYYTMDDATGTDETGNYDGTWGTTPTVVTGVVNNACINSTGLMDCGAQLLDDLGPFAVALWLDTDGITGTCYPFGQYTSGASGRFFMQVTTSLVELYSGPALVASANHTSYTGWMHIIFQRKTDLTWGLYFDDVGVDTGSAIGIQSTNTTIAGITGVANFDSPAIDEVRIFDRELSSTERTALYEYR